MDKLIDHFELMTVGQIQASLAQENPETMFFATALVKAKSHDELEDRIGIAANELAEAMTQIARIAAESQPHRLLKLARLAQAFAEPFQEAAALYCPEGERASHIPPASSLSEAIQGCIKVAVDQSMYWLAEALTLIAQGLDGDQIRMQKGFEALERAVRNRRTIQQRAA